MKAKYLITVLPLLLLSTACGENKTSETITEVDYTGQTHLKLDADLFAKVMKNKSNGTFDGENYCDFNVDGVEKMLTESDYPTGSQSKVFTDYVDGDTTSFTTYNGFYNVKVRYLAVDTPESTSEIEEWGKSASKFNKSKLSAAKHVIVQSAGCARTGKTAVADLDGYQRSLAYVWYSDVENPTQNDFRNLNLELVQEGYSIFSGSREDMVEFETDENGENTTVVKDDSFYNAFVAANDQAKALKKHIYSDEKDPNYYYGAPKKLGLDTLYNTDYYTKTVAYKNGSVQYSTYCDEYTRWTFEGVVSRKVGNAFYIQDTIDGKTYGLYIFTFRTYPPVQVGNRIRVSGVLSYYGGIYELSGVSYSMFNHQEGDIEYVKDEKGNKIVEEVTPIKASVKDIKDGKYQSVLVEVNDETSDNELYFGTTWNKFEQTGEVTSYAFGGSEEINSYNTTHPFYNTNNDMVLFGKWGSKMENVDDFNTLTQSNDYLRVKIPDAIRVMDEEDKTIVTYKYFTGTAGVDGKDAPHYYIQKDAETVYKLTNGLITEDQLTEEQKKNLIKESYVPKKVKNPIGIAQQYISTSGNATYSLNICSNADFAGAKLSKVGA